MSKIGALRSRRDLIEAVVFPNASFAREFEPYVVTTKDGKIETADGGTLVLDVDERA